MIFTDLVIKIALIQTLLAPNILYLLMNKRQENEDTQTGLESILDYLSQGWEKDFHNVIKERVLKST